MLKKAGIILLIAVFVVSIAGTALAAPRGEDAKKIPPGQLKKMGINTEEDETVKQAGPPPFVLQKKEEQRLRFLEKKQIRVCGKELLSDLPPVIKEGRTLIPVRAVVMGLGAKIEWDEEEGLVTVTKGDITVEFYIDDTVFYVNGEKWELDVPAQLISNRTFVPLRYLAQALGKKVKYDKDKDVITIGDDVLEYFRVGGLNALDLDKIRVDDFEDDAGAVLEVHDFKGFAGIAVKAQDEENTYLYVYLNEIENEVDADELNELPLENGDVIFVKAEVAEEEDGEETISTFYYKVTLVGVPTAEFVFKKPSGLVETDEDIPGFSITVKNVKNIEDDVPLRYLLEVTRGDLDGRIIAYGDPVERTFTIEDGKAYFGPPAGFALDDLPELMDEEGVTIPFTVWDGLEEGIYRFTISLVKVDGDSLVTSKEFTIKVDPADE
jgi:hypothetical protein